VISLGQRLTYSVPKRGFNGPEERFSMVNITN
jgi:hypothetical protein